MPWKIEHTVETSAVKLRSDVMGSTGENLSAKQNKPNINTHTHMQIVKFQVRIC